MRRETALILFITLMLFPTKAALCAWSTDPKVNTPVCTAEGSQYYPQIVSDGEGGNIILWNDNRGEDWEFFAQRLDSSGNPLWTADGVGIPGRINDLIPDGSGGVIYVWTWSALGSIDDIYAQRIDSNGNALWPFPGVFVCADTSDQSNPQLISDGSGGAIIAWQDSRNSPPQVYRDPEDIYAQRLDSNGNALWTVDGVPICTAQANQFYPQLTSDGSGGAIITWEDWRSENDSDIYAQRLDSSGQPLWSANGVPVSTIIVTQSYPQIISDGSGGAIICWHTNYDPLTGNHGVYAQRIGSNGESLWNAEEVFVSSGYSPQIISNGSGGAIVVNIDYINHTYALYAQRLDSSGNILWSANGAPITMSLAYSFHLSSDGSGGAFITWATTSPHYNIYAQHLDSSGKVLWSATGAPVCLARRSQDYPQIIPDGSGGAIVTWHDDRVEIGYYSYYYNIYAQRINPDGSLGTSPPPSPTEQASLIVPWFNDSGGSNRMATFLSVFNPTSYNITLTVTYKAPSSIDATPKANTFILGPGEAKIGRPFQASGTGEKQESGPPYSMPNAIASAPFGSAIFTAQMPAGFKIYGDVLRMGAIDLDGDGTLEPFSGIGPAVSK